MQVDDLFIIKQLLQAFLDRRVNMEATSMLGVKARAWPLQREALTPS